MSAFYESGPYGLVTFVFLTLLMGGAAAMATGRALALTWRPALHCIAYTVPLAATIAFLYFALFEEPVIPLYALGAAFASADVTGLALSLRGLALLFIIHAALALLGYRLTRVRQMCRQYRFACVQWGPLNWRMVRETAPASRNSTA